MPEKRKPGGTRGGRESKKPPAPEPAGFNAFGLREELVAVTGKLGWITPTPIQLQAIPLALEGCDLYGVAQTGTGKTAAFVLPILNGIAAMAPAPAFNPYCVALAPTRELVQQIAGQFEEFSKDLPIRVLTAYGGTSDRPQSTALSQGVEVVAGAPGRMLDLMRQGYLQFTNLAYCVLDEADRMFDMGFIDDIRTILNRMPSRRQTMMFSATLPSQVKRLASDYLYYPREIRLGTTAPPAELKHELWMAHSDRKYDALLELLDSDRDSVLVFCKTKKRAGELAKRLAREAGESVAAIHADRTQKEREAALARFKEGKLRILVATDVASRGLDIEGIALVVNYDVPLDQEDYVHRVGRTARAKRTGLAVTLVAPDEERYVRRIEGFIKNKIERRGDGGKEVPAEQPKRPRQSERSASKSKRREQDKSSGKRRRRGGSKRGERGAKPKRPSGDDSSYVD